MYKHNAFSIKETNEKQFVSIEDKTRWNNKAESIHDHNDLYYTKEEIDNKFGSTYLEHEGEIISSTSVGGYITDIEIFGSTKQNIENINLKVNMNDGRLNVDGNRLDDTTHSVSDYITVRENDYITFYINKKPQLLNVFFYDVYKNLIKRDMGRVEGTDSVYDTKIPYDVKYIRVYTHTTDHVDFNIERIHLDQIQSVGKKRNDGLYEVDIVSTGKNIFNIHEYYNKIKDIAGVSLIDGNAIKFDAAFAGVLNNVSTRCNVLDAHMFRKNTQYRIKYKTSHYNDLYVHFMIRYSDGVCNYLPMCDVDVDFITYADKTVESVSVAWHTQANNGNSILSDIEVCPVFLNNTIDSGYNEYVEDRLKLLLPTPLEKINNVADRVYIRNDGMLCIDKYIISKRVLPEYLTYGNTGNDFAPSMEYFWSDKIINGFNGNLNEISIVCNKFESICYNNYVYDNECVYTDTGNRIYFYIDPNRGGLSYFKNNEVIVKVAINEPETIEVGHISNFMIRSFEPITNVFIDNNIIGGKIKCRIPDSIGAIVDMVTDMENNMIKSVERIEKINNSVSDLNSSNNNGIIYIDKSISGFTDNIKIEGQTIKNLHKFGTFNVTKFSDHYVEKLICKKSDIKINTVYTIFIHYNIIGSSSSYSHLEFGESTSGGVMISHPHMEISHGNEIWKTYSTVYPNLSGVYKFTISINQWRNDTAEYFGIRPIRRRGTPVSTEHGQGTFKIVLVEGNHVDKDINFFEYVRSVASDNQLKLVSKNKNLFNIETDFTCMTSTTYYKHSNGITVTGTNTVKNGFIVKDNFIIPEGDYKILYDAYPLSTPEKGDCYAQVVNAEGTHYTDTALSGVLKFTVKNGNYISLRFYSNVGAGRTQTVRYENIRIVKVSDSNDHIEHEYYTNNITLSAPLRSLPDGTRDTIEKINDKYYVVRRCGEISLNGTETWSRVLQIMENTTRFGTSIIKDIKPNTTNIYCSHFNPSTDDLQYNSDIEGISVNSNGNLYIRINNSSLENVTDDTTKVNSFKKWLSTNHVSVIYDLKDPVLEEIDTDLNIRLFDDATYIIVDTGIVKPIISFNSNVNLQSSVKSIINKVKTLEESDIYNYRLQLSNTYLSDRLSYDLSISLCDSRFESITEDKTLFELMLHIIVSGNHAYTIEELENMIDFYTIIGKLNYDMANILFDLIYS